jgi:hypothetical protein
MSSKSSTPAATIQSDPNITVGPRKRLPTQRAIENGDPFARKRAKRTTIEEVNEPVPPPCAQPHNSMRVLEAADGSDDDSAEVTALPDTDEEDENASEDDDAELSKGYIYRSIQIDAQTAI